jgi:phosphatidylglycerophosphate synthase
MLSFPNLLSILRLILIPFFVYAFVVQQMEWFFILFFIAGLSDCLDGFLARRLNITSQLGHFLDTLADVPFYATAFVILLLSYPKTISEYSLWIYIFVMTSFLPFLLSLHTYKRIYFEHTKLFKLISSVLFMVVLTSLFINVSAMIPMIIIGFIIANLQLSYIILIKRLN